MLSIYVRTPTTRSYRNIESSTIQYMHSSFLRLYVLMCVLTQARRH